MNLEYNLICFSNYSFSIIKLQKFLEFLLNHFSLRHITYGKVGHDRRSSIGMGWVIKQDNGTAKKAEIEENHSIHNQLIEQLMPQNLVFMCCPIIFPILR